MKLAINALVQKGPNIRYLECIDQLRGNVHLYYWFGAARFIVKHPKDIFLYADNNAIFHLDSTFALTPLSVTKDEHTVSISEEGL